MFSCNYHCLGMSQWAKIRSVNSLVVKHYVESKKKTAMHMDFCNQNIPLTSTKTYITVLCLQWSCFTNLLCALCISAPVLHDQSGVVLILHLHVLTCTHVIPSLVYSSCSCFNTSSINSCCNFSLQ